MRNIDITDEASFKRLPLHTRVKMIEKMHDLTMESAMFGGYIDKLLAMREDGVEMNRKIVLIVKLDVPGFPDYMVQNNGAEWHRELIDVSSPPDWISKLPAYVSERIAWCSSREPKTKWIKNVPTGKITELGEEEKETVEEIRPADMWAITCAGGNAIPHGVDLDVLKELVDERERGDVVG